MNYISVLIFGLTFFIVNKGAAQDFSAHKWENRLVLVKTTDIGSAMYQKQVKELEQNLEGLDERKIVIYQISNHKYKRGLSEDGKWKDINAKSKKKYIKMGKSSFEIILIGLDGGVKLKQNDFLMCGELFSKIDSMPMRKREMKQSY